MLSRLGRATIQDRCAFVAASRLPSIDLPPPLHP